MSVIQGILLGAIGAVLVGVVARWRRGEFGPVRGMTWSALCAAGAASVAAPELATAAARAVGVGRGADLVAYLAIVASFYGIFRLLLRTERLRRDVTELVRQIAIERRLLEDAARDRGTPSP